MAQDSVKSEQWGEFPGDKKNELENAVANSLPKYSDGWKAFQETIENELQKTNTIRRNVQLENLSVHNSYVEIDICLESKVHAGILIHLSGRQTPKHEKELLEIIAVTTVNDNYKYGVLITRMDNHLKLEGLRTSFEYCSGPLLKLVTPILEMSHLKGLLIIGYNAPV
jgi:hypothetical protein